MSFKEGFHSSEVVLFLNEYVLRVKKAVMIHRPFYKNTVRKGSATHGGLSIESLADSFRAHDKMYNDIIRLYPELKNHSLAFLLDVCTLKYFEAKEKFQSIPKAEQPKAEIRLKSMHQYIKKYAWEAVFDHEIYWKTRLFYILLK